MIRSATQADADVIARIYNHYITASTATFEEQPVTAEVIRERMAEVEQHGLPWIVAEEAGEIVGYAYAGPLGARCAYRYSVETTVYVDCDLHGRGTGTELYRELLRLLAEAGRHVAIARISLPNEQSVALHDKLGFEKVGHLAEVGFKFGRWLDVGYYRRGLE